MSSCLCRPSPWSAWHQTPPSLLTSCPPALPLSSGLTLDEKGFLAVNRHLQSVSDPYVFAAGDVSSMLEHPRPKVGREEGTRADKERENRRVFFSGVDGVLVLISRERLKMTNITGEERGIGIRRDLEGGEI